MKYFAFFILKLAQVPKNCSISYSNAVIPLLYFIYNIFRALKSEFRMRNLLLSKNW
jgi:hypothetical protein